MKDNLILIGMPGAGKSTVGVILAKTLAMDFVDGDLEICKETGKTLQEILDNEGKEAFLDIENRVICGLNPHHTVVATGGSVPLEPEAMGHMKDIGTVIYLKVELEELRARQIAGAKKEAEAILTKARESARHEREEMISRATKELMEASASAAEKIALGADGDPYDQFLRLAERRSAHEQSR